MFSFFNIAPIFFFSPLVLDLCLACVTFWSLAVFSFDVSLMPSICIINDSNGMQCSSFSLLSLHLVPILLYETLVPSLERSV